MIENKLNHIAFILDGNKRWSKKHKIKSIEGYKKGFDNIGKIIDHTLHLEIPNLTLFTLSSENFQRSSINLIYEIIYNNFSKLIDDLVKKKNIRIKIFGSKEKLPIRINEILDNAENISINNNGLNINIAFNYGFKNEVKEVLQKFKNNIDKINLDNISDIDNLFYLGGVKDPDILIRTGGYKRLSNFIMYNLTYTELFFTDTLWPDFSITEYDEIINSYLNINRKYGL